MPARGRWALAALGLALALAWVLLAQACMPYYPIGIFNDDARFVLHGYQLLGWEPVMPDDEVGRYSPGWGALLAAGLWLVGPSGLPPLRWMPVAFMLLSAGLLGLLARRWLPPLGALAVAACFLLNPVAVTLGSTLLADPAWLALSLGAALLADRWLDGRPRLGYLVGLLAGAGVLFRPEGWVVPGALVLWLAARGRWPELVRVGLGLVPPVAVELLLIPQAHASQVSSFGPGTGWILENARTFLTRLPRMLGVEYLGLPEGLAPSAGAVVLALALAGLVRARRELLSPLLLLVGAILAVQLVWPFPDARYLLLAWPCLVLLGALAWPRRDLAAPGLALAAILLGTPALAQAVRISAERAAVEGRWESLEWLRENTPADSLCMSMYATRVRLLARRPCIQPQPADLWCQVLATACAEDVDFLCWEPALQLRRDFRGQSQVDLPFRVDLWMDSSTLVRRVAATAWDRVYAVEVDREAFQRAWRLYLAAGRVDWAREAPRAEGLLRQALRTVPDFPEAKSSLAVLLLQTGRSRPEAIGLLEAVVRQYPVFLDSTYNLGLALAQEGRLAQARRVLEAGRDQARALGAQDRVPTFEEALRALPRSP